METFKMEKEDVDSWVRGRVEEALNYSPKEASFNSMTTVETRFIRPNNYRRGVNVKLLKDSGVSKILTTINDARQGKHNRLVNIPNYRNLGISLQLGKNKLIGIYSQVFSQGKKYWFRIERNTVQEIEDAIEKKKEEIKFQIDNSLRLFCEEFDLGFKFDKPFWVRSETAIHGDDYVDRIPRDLIVYDTIFKKVYKDDLEFKSGKNEEPVVHLKDYLNNRSLERFSPQIVSELNSLHFAFDRFTVDALNPLTEQIKLHLEVQRETLSALKDLRDNIKDNSHSVGLSVPLLPMDDVVSGEVRISPKCDSSSFTLPETISKEDIVNKTKKFRLFRANQLLKEYGWNSQRW
jgi:hypothetical protein